MDATSSLPSPEARNSGKAIWSLVLGILSTFCLWVLGSIPAIILGVLAIKEIDGSQGRLKGRGVAIGGIVTGGIGVVSGAVIFIIALSASLTVPAYEKVREKANQAKQISEMRQIALGCLYYSSSNENRFPRELSELVPEYLDSADLLEWTGSETMPVDAAPYLYRTDVDMAQFNEPFLASPVPISGKVAVAFIDGRVESIPEEVFERDYRGKFP